MSGNHYDKGEKEGLSNGHLVLVMKPRIFDAVVYGFPPGESRIDTSVAMCRTILAPLIKEIKKKVIIAPGTNRKAHREVHIYGCTDRVQFKRDKNGGKTQKYKKMKLRKDRANAFKIFLKKVLPKNLSNITMVPKALNSEKKPFIGKGGGMLLRAQNRSVGIILVVPPLPPNCYAAGIGPTEKETIEAIRKALNENKAESYFGKRNFNFIKKIVELLIKNGNDEYLIRAKIHDGVTRWSVEYRILYKKLEKLSQEKREEYRKRYKMKPFPNVKSKQILWYSNLTNAILRQEKPHIFEIQTISLMAELRKSVRAACRETRLIKRALASHVREIADGRNCIRRTRDFRRALIDALGGGSTVDNFIERSVRGWMAEKERDKNNIYSEFIKVFGKPINNKKP